MIVLLWRMTRPRSQSSIRWLVVHTHRDNDIPAIGHPDGTKEWWVNDLRHRTDGPAIERSDGLVGWWIHGSEYQLKTYCLNLRYSQEQMAQWILEYD